VQPKSDVDTGQSEFLHMVGHGVASTAKFGYFEHGPLCSHMFQAMHPRDPCYLNLNHFINRPCTVLGQQPCTVLLTSWGSLASLYASMSARQAKVSICPGKEATRSSKIALAAARFRCRLKCVMALAYSVPRREGLAPKCRNLKSPESSVFSSAFFHVFFVEETC
jgi:hypothetical protein